MQFLQNSMIIYDLSESEIPSLRAIVWTHFGIFSRLNMKREFWM
jgi:hypothetical protein